MKKVLFFFLLLGSIGAMAQGVQSLTIVPAVGYSGTPYVVQAIRNKSTYALDADGLARFKAAVSSGLFNLTVVNSGTYSSGVYTPTVTYAPGCTIAAGTQPGLSPPSCATVTTSPPTTTAVAAYSKTLQAEDASPAQGNVSTGVEGTFRAVYPLNSDYMQWSLTDAPIAASNYTIAIRYISNFDSNIGENGIIKLIINGVTQNVATEGAAGGTRIATLTGQSLLKGANTIRIEGNSRDHFIDYLRIIRAAD